MEKFRYLKMSPVFLLGYIGASVLVVGIAMVLLPGPALLVIPLGLAISGVEIAWASRWLKQMNRQFERAHEVARNTIHGKI